MSLDKQSKFHPNGKVEIIASIDNLIDYFKLTGEKDMEAKNHAFIILGNKIGTILGASIFNNQKFYSIEMETEPLILLPECFLKKI